MQSAQHKKLYENVLSTSQPIQSLEKALNSVLRLAIVDHSHFNLLLHHINWFNEPYLSLISVLEKALRIYRGRGKQSEKVVYNLLADGMWSTVSSTKSCECLMNLIKPGFDKRILKQSLDENFPHKVTELEVQQNYLTGLMLIYEQFDQLRYDILEIVVLKLASFDTELCTKDNTCSYLFATDSERRSVMQKSAYSDDHIKFDCLFTSLLQKLIKINNINGKQVLQQLLLLFKSHLILIQQTNFVQFLIYYFVEGKKQSKEFVAFLMGEILEKMQNKGNNKKILVSLTNYLASYVSRSVNLSQSFISKTVFNLINLIKQIFTARKINNKCINSLSQPPQVQKQAQNVNLSKIFEDNFDILLLLQTVIWIWTTRPECRNHNGEQLKKLIVDCQQIHFTYFIHHDLLKQSKLIDMKSISQVHQCFQISHKFNPPLLKRLSIFVDPLIRFYERQQQAVLKIEAVKSQVKYQAIPEGLPSKKVKSEKKQSVQTKTSF